MEVEVFFSPDPGNMESVCERGRERGRHTNQEHTQAPNTHTGTVCKHAHTYSLIHGVTNACINSPLPRPIHLP